MKKIVLFILLTLILVGCQMQQPIKESVETKPIVKEITVIEKAQPVTEKFFFKTGETKNVRVGEKDFEVKLMSLSNRAKFLVNSEVTKQLSVGNFGELRGRHEIRVLQIYSGGADVEITFNP